MEARRLAARPAQLAHPARHRGGYLITGSFVVEQIFGVPGVGRYFVAAVLARDYPLIAGLTVMLALVIIVANLLVDVAQALLDPRVREAPRPA